MVLHLMVVPERMEEEGVMGEGLEEATEDQEELDQELEEVTMVGHLHHHKALPQVVILSSGSGLLP